ncbi:hypothetical protein SLEP1_g44807 [Rubroshorea leprosula]|uniref:Uncharacterized protein n=1 Tax=Rubroshorea leprosula TaxID=152421 RepID=A0AAV5LHR5_9ROSI|nr:hypothetical protein SLEP1_g44807 [Rubroshorea leprosula]
MARKVKRYGRANVSPQRSGQTQLIQKSPRFRSAMNQLVADRRAPKFRSLHELQLTTGHSPFRISTGTGGRPIQRHYTCELMTRNNRESQAVLRVRPDSALLPAAARKKKKKKPSQPLRKPVRKLDFSFFSCSKTQIEPRNSPPCRKLPDLLCSSLCCPPAALVVGANFGHFWNFPSISADLLPQLVAPALLAGFWFLIVLSVSTEIECSVYASEVSKFMVMPV